MSQTANEEMDRLAELLWHESNPEKSAVHITMYSNLRSTFIQGYKKDKQFKMPYEEASQTEDARSLGKKFMKDEQGLLFFENADHQLRLCVPKEFQQEVLTKAHESPMETAHMDSSQLWIKLSSWFYWRHMKVDIKEFCWTCDVCQKMKHPNFSRFGLLIPILIPTCPYESISMDFIMDLPWSGKYNAIYIVVNRLTKHAQFIPTTMGLDAEEFVSLFTKHVASHYGLPANIIADRDPRWTSDFWKGVSKSLKTRMALSSLHHPQHDGQTEIVNKFLETMLRAYIAKDIASWSEWLHILEFTYNAHCSVSTTDSPFFLLLGFQPTSLLEQITKGRFTGNRAYHLTSEVSEFLKNVEIHRDNA